MSISVEKDTQLRLHVALPLFFISMAAWCACVWATLYLGVFIEALGCIVIASVARWFWTLRKLIQSGARLR